MLLRIERTILRQNILRDDVMFAKIRRVVTERMLKRIF